MVALPAKGDSMLTAELGAFAAGLQYRQLPEPVAHKARACLLHGVAVGLAGHTSPYAHVARQVATWSGSGPPSAALLLDGEQTGLAGAVQANAVLLAARAQEDAFGPVHLGPVVIPVALALARHSGSSGEEVIAGLVAAYEVGLAIFADTSEHVVKRGFRPAALFGAFGAFGAAVMAARRGFEPPADPRLTQMIPRISVQSSASRPRLTTRVTLRLQDGTEHAHELDANERFSRVSPLQGRRLVQRLYPEMRWSADHLAPVFDQLERLHQAPRAAAVFDRLATHPA